MLWAGRPLSPRVGDSDLVSEALLDLFDPGLERGNVPLQFGEVALEDLAPAELVREACLDPAQRLRDRLVLLLESVESPVDLVEVPEHLVAQLGQHLGEPTVHISEPAVDRGELASQELDKLLVLARGHGPCLPQIHAPRKCVQRKMS